jgi:hypothetical protein
MVMVVVVAVLLSLLLFVYSWGMDKGYGSYYN